MKPGLAAAFLLLLWLVAFGVPGIGPDIHRLTVPGTESAVLPMTFAHNDHFSVPCADCHHEFVDGTSGPPCLACHVTDLSVAPLFEAQFHGLCRSCHEKEEAQNKHSGPTRRCLSCHVADTAF